MPEGVRPTTIQHADASRVVLDLDAFVVRAGHSFQSEPCSLQLKAGEIGFITGPIGCGKSLVAEALARVRRPDVELLGELRTPPGVSFVPQDPRLAVLATDRVSTLFAAVDRARGLRRRAWSSFLRRAAWRDEAEALLERLRLTPSRLWGLEFRELSSSERHRVLLGLAIAEKNPLLIYDGAAEGLDPTDRARVTELLSELLGRGTTILATARRPGSLDLPESQSVDWGDATGRSSALPLLRRQEAVETAPGEEQASPRLVVERLRVARGKLQLGDRKREAFPVDGVNLQILPGETLVLFGGAGSGKTTLLEALAGLVRPHSGRVVLRDRDVTWATGARAARLRRRVQLVFQDAAAVLDPRRTVSEHLGEARRLAEAQPDRSGAGSAAEWLDRLGLPERLLELSADHVSAGEAQRIDLARSLVLGPELVLLDSPRVSGADTDGGTLAALMLTLKREGRSFLIATSDPAMAATLGDRLAVLHAGRIVECGPTASVLNHPAHPATAALLTGRLPAPTDPRHPLRGCPHVASCARRVLPECDAREPRLHAIPMDQGRRSTEHRVACFHPLP